MSLFTSCISKEALEKLLLQYPPSALQGTNNVNFFSYGTAGIRTKGETLPSVGVRIGLLCALRSYLAHGQAVGAMVTASHNAHPDNGIKIVDTNAGMLARSWEGYAAKIANCLTADEILSVLESVWAAEKGAVRAEKHHALVVVHVGRDTRPSGVPIVDAIADAVTLFAHCVAGAATTDAPLVAVVNHGVVTTPILHAMVYLHNQTATNKGLIAAAIAAPNETAYFDLVATSFEALHRQLTADQPAARKRLIVDCSNGVGAISLQKLFAASSYLQKVYELVLVNDSVDQPTLLNYECGADYCQRLQKPPMAFEGLDQTSALPTSFYCLDGDSDRLVSFAYPSSSSSEAKSVGVLLDGDRIAILFATLLRKLIPEEALARLDVGVVQTAYANGASTAYAAGLGLKTYCAATGVKHCHPIAEHRDIGLYFEANGHGTVLFQEHVQKSVPVVATLAGLLSQVCGDAVGDLLACEVALLALGWPDATSWLSMYKDLPSNQSKITVPNPSKIKNTPDERRATEPLGLQESIDALVESSGDKSARAFVRPSGTEPIVRLYVEASDTEMVMQLKELITAVVLEMIG